MKAFFTLFASFLTITALAQAPAIQWQKSLGGTGHESAYAVQQTADGGYVVAGSSTSTDGDVTGNNGNQDYWVAKLNDTGAIQWQKSLGGTSVEWGNAVRQTADGGYIVAGFSLSNNGDVGFNHGNTDCWLVKLNDTGAIQWSKALGGSAADYAWSVEQTTDGGYIMGGYSHSNDGDVSGNHGAEDCWIVKLDDTGAVQWQKMLGGSATDYAYSIQQTADGGFIVAGTSASNDGDVTGNHGGLDYWIVKLNDTGAIAWQKSLGGLSDESPRAIQQTRDGGYIATGYSASNDFDVTGNHGDIDYWVVKTDDTGGIQWQHSIGGSGTDFGWSVVQTTDTGYIVAGYSNSTDYDVTGNHGDLDYWSVKLDDTGAIAWQKSLGGTNPDNGFSIQQTTDSGFILIGQSASNDSDVTGNHGNSNDYWVVKLGEVLPTAVRSTTPQTFSLFPNPATTEVRIQTSEAILSVLLTDLSGKEVFRAGNTTVIPTAALANGLYFVRVQTASSIATQKVLVQHP